MDNPNQDISSTELDLPFPPLSKNVQQQMNENFIRIREEERRKTEMLEAAEEADLSNDDTNHSEENSELETLTQNKLQNDSGFVTDVKLLTNKEKNNKENENILCNINNHPTKPEKIAAVTNEMKHCKISPPSKHSNQFVTPLRPLPLPKAAQSLPSKPSSSAKKQTPRIMATVDMRSHLNTPIFQISARKPKARKQLSTSSTLTSVLEDSESDNKQIPLSEQKVKDVFKCITVKGIEYIVLNELGKGGSSLVYHCFDPIKHQECAMKVVDLRKDKDEAIGFINEVNALKRLQDCDQIIQLYDYELVNNDRTLYMVLEKGGRDFAHILREHSRNSAHLPAFMVHFYWMQMLHAVQQIHSKGVIHSDLKPANFIEIRERLKLIDFGISSCVQVDMTSVTKTVALGTFGYISPEALGADRGCGRSPSEIRTISGRGQPQKQYKVGFKSDVWSLGCILYQLVYKRTPFGHIQHNAARLAAIMDPQHVIDYPPADWVPQAVIACIKACLQFDARRRPTVMELIKAEHAIGANMN